MRVVVPAFARVLALVSASTLFAAAADASGPLFFQHGGRPTAQAGAFVARATDAGGLDYNPAAIARLQGSHYQLGFDYTAPLDDYFSSTGSFGQKHLITVSPDVYASWHLPEDRYPFAFGIGIDHRAWYRAEWEAALFPGRFLTRHQELELWSVHPVVAYQLSERWSVGAGARYYTGNIMEGRNQVLRLPGGTPFGSSSFDVEVERTSDSDVDGLSFDLGFHFGAEAWGWGLVFDTGGEVDGSGTVSYRGRDVPNDAGLQQSLTSVLQSGSAGQSFELPPEARTGLWIAPSPSWSFEIDLVWTQWSKVDETTVSFSRHAFGPLVGTPPQAVAGSERRARNWEDTLSPRLGMEFGLGERWALSAGVALEPSPVPTSTLEPGFARGDALVLATGITYRIRNISFDLGYSYHRYDDRRAGGQELQRPQVGSTYKTRDQAFGFSVSWGG